MSVPFPQTTRRRPIGNDQFAVVIPVYNHQATIAAVVRKACRHRLPVIVVDDGSTDTTYEKIRSMRNIRIIRHHENRGKGAALMTGMKAAAKLASWAICLDADGQHDPVEITKLKEVIPKDQRPIVIGKRQGMGVAPWTSRFGREFSNFWVWMSGGVRLTDTQCGYRIYPLPEVLKLNVKSRRYQYEIEVLAKAAWKAIPIIETPVSVSYHPGGLRVSHFHPWRDFIRNSETFSRLIVKRIFTPRLWNSGKKMIH
jgi:glycosyltransferase involved in cell wall biosynthesis